MSTHGEIMAALVVAPVQWSRFRDIDDVEPINESDSACLAEIREVLCKYGNEDRFGVALLHTHFPLGDDEAMLEDTDDENRVQTLRPTKLSDMGPNDVGTIWHLKGHSLQAMAWCRQYCKRWAFGHRNAHTRTK